MITIWVQASAGHIKSSFIGDFQSRRFASVINVVIFLNISSIVMIHFFDVCEIYFTFIIHVEGRNYYTYFLYSNSLLQVILAFWKSRSYWRGIWQNKLHCLLVGFPLCCFSRTSAARESRDWQFQPTWSVWTTGHNPSTLASVMWGASRGWPVALNPTILSR